MLAEWLRRVEESEAAAEVVAQLAQLAQLAARVLARERERWRKGRPTVEPQKVGGNTGGDASWHASRLTDIGGDNEALGIDLDLELELLATLYINPI